MDFLSKLFGSKQPANGKQSKGGVQFDEAGKVVSIQVPVARWTLRQNGQNKYYRMQAKSLLQASELLKKLDSIPQLTYYIVETPNGSLGRDIQGFYTEAPLKTENLVVESRTGPTPTVESVSLTGFGDTFANQRSVAVLKKSGEYARLVLLLHCGKCGYESPVETQAGPFVRECYCCGAKNQSQRGNINVFLGSSMVEI